MARNPTIARTNKARRIMLGMVGAFARQLPVDMLNMARCPGCGKALQLTQGVT